MITFESFLKENTDIPFQNGKNAVGLFDKSKGGKFTDGRAAEGEFESEKKQTFEYRKAYNTWAIEQGYPHQVAVGDQILFAIVRKMEVVLVVDVDDNGKAVPEKHKVVKHLWDKWSKMGSGTMKSKW